MSEGKVVAIHQPNFFPWLGYFNKIAISDVFIVLNNVQFPKKGGNWSNRVRMLVNTQAAWVTMPVVRDYQGVRTIDEMLIDNSQPWRIKLLKTIELNYRRAPFFETVFPLIIKLVNNPTNSLQEYNLEAIINIANSLNIDTSKLILASKLQAKGKATNLLISMVKTVGATAYLCGGGAGGYQEDEKFAEAGIKLIYQNFQHPLYFQNNTKEFIPGLSIIDALMNCGFEKVQDLILQKSMI